MKDICDKKDRYFKNICEYYNSDKDFIFTVDNVIIKDLNILEINKKYTLYTDTNSYYKTKLKQPFKSGNYLVKSYVCDKNGTKELMKYLEGMSFPTILAGGDVTGASKYFNAHMYYVSTGGGSTLEYLEGKKFKTLERLNGNKEL